MFVYYPSLDQNEAQYPSDDLRGDNTLLYLLGSFYREHEFIPYRLQEPESSHHHQHVYFKPGCRQHLGVNAKHASYDGNNCQWLLGLRTYGLRGAFCLENVIYVQHRKQFLQPSVITFLRSTLRIFFLKL